MKATFWDAGWTALLGCLVVVSCAGKSLNHVGEVNDAGAAGDDTGAGGKLVGPGGEGHGGRAGSVGEQPGGNGHVGGEPGAGGAPEQPPFVCEACEVVAETPAIRALWAASDRLYWTEYGSFDVLDNYEDDGRLMSLAFEGGEPSVVASRLGGPTWLAISEQYAYVWLEHANAGTGALQLARVPLEGGEPELLQGFPDGLGGFGPGQDWGRRHLVAKGGYAYWFKPTRPEMGPTGDDGTIYRLAEDSAEPPEAFQEVVGFRRLLADETNVYVHVLEGITAVPHEGGAATPLFTSPDGYTEYDDLTLAGDAFYGIEWNTKQYIVTLPLAGGSFERVAGMNRQWRARLVTDGSSFVGNVRLPFSDEVLSAVLVAGDLTEPDSATTLASGPPWSDEQFTHETFPAWDATATTVYLGYEDRLYSVPRAP
jgi:hypothetical protein